MGDLPACRSGSIIMVDDPQVDEGRGLLTPGQKDGIRNAAKSRGKSISGWLRYVALRSASMQRALNARQSAA
jgi:hypothetical protein